jgi:hypothetical protein
MHLPVENSSQNLLVEDVSIGQAALITFLTALISLKISAKRSYNLRSISPVIDVSGDKRRPTRDDAEAAQKSLQGGLSAPVALLD